MQFSDRIQMEKDLFHLYKLYGLTSRVTPSTPVTRAVIFILSPLNEVQLSDRIPMENGPFHLYKLYGSTSSVTPLTLVGLDFYPFDEMEFSDRIRMETALFICTNRTNRQPGHPLDSDKK